MSSSIRLFNQQERRPAFFWVKRSTASAPWISRVRMLGRRSMIGRIPCGIVVSDRYASYNSIPVAHRQVYWAHLLRDFARIALRPGTAGKMGKRLVTYGHLLFRWTKKHTVIPDAWAWLQRRIECLLCQAIALPCEKTARTCWICGQRCGLLSRTLRCRRRII